MTAWIDVVGWTLLHFVWEGTLIALLASAVLRILRHASAQARYLTACTGLLVALAAPVVTVAVATWRVPDRTGATRELAAPLAVAGVGGVSSPHAPFSSGVPTGAVALDNETMASALSAFVACWAAGVVLLTARLASGWWRVRRLHAEAWQSPASGWLGPAARLAARLGVWRDIHVVDSLRVDTPAVIGWLRPVILLPAAALASLSTAQVEAILAHELAHIRRHDFLVNLLQTLAETVLFYHPAVWWLSALVRMEREHCCDDIAVDVAGDPVIYAEALTALAVWGRLHAGESRPQQAPLAIAATSGPLLQRVRRVLRLPDTGSSRSSIPIVLAATMLLVLLVGTRLVIVAQSPPSPDVAAADRRLGPADLNRLLGFNLFPGPVHYATDDPVAARAWDVTVAYPNGVMTFMGFTGRNVVRYAYGLERIPVLEGPSWLDTESLTIRAGTSADQPDADDYRAAIRAELEGRYGMSLRRDARLFPAYGLQLITKDRLGPAIKPSTAECFDSEHDRLDTIGPTLRARGQQMQFCGIYGTIRGPRAYRATIADLARSMRGFALGPVGQADGPEREVIDQTGLAGVYDFELDLGFLPLAAIASAHPTLALGFGPAIRTFPQALEEQLGLRLVPTEALRDVAVIVDAHRDRQARAVLEQTLAMLRSPAR